ncbi:Exostosin domain-containing protein [Durusdinium trenchii]|uniref:Exostosin domain-containing protein n=1 Tax=Durusdinium trenchii TaxID=1381693 RepID=A0ABP0I7Z4_9DINO
MSTWPSTAELLEHFKEVAEEYGVMPYAKMCTNVGEMTIKTPTRQEQTAEMTATGRNWFSQTYTLTLEPTDGTGDGRGDNIGLTGEPSFKVDHSAVIMYPGNLTLPKRFDLKGEDSFDGPISYAIMNDFDYNATTGKRIGILGHGAFAVENLRTCLEYSCKKADLSEILFVKACLKREELIKRIRYPILEYQDNWVRSGSAAVEELSTESDLGCSIFIQNGDARFSGACAAVQCALDSGYAAPGMSAASGNSRDIGVTDTATAGWQTWSLVEIPDESEQLKTVFLYRTGNYIATLKRTYTWSTGGVTVSVGSLPTSNGNNYGPVACPGSNLVLTSTEATAISPLDLKVCGSTGKWVYWNAINLLVDQSLYAKFTDDATATSGSTRNIGAVPFLDGEVAGTWRSFGVVFYCDDYARTDLTTCASANQKMFYVADPNPEEQFGSTADLGFALKYGCLAASNLKAAQFCTTTFAGLRAACAPRALLYLL